MYAPPGLLGTAAAFFFPASFEPLSQYITYFLMISMFGMGLTLTLPDFKEIARRPWPILLGVNEALAMTSVSTLLSPIVTPMLMLFLADKWISILGIGGVVFPAVATNSERLAAVGLIAFVAGRVFRFPESANRTMAVEIGTRSAASPSRRSRPPRSLLHRKPRSCPSLSFRSRGLRLGHWYRVDREVR